jgi:thiol-disulfide isomerase/thioredoxin
MADVEMWIDKNTFLVRKIAMDMTKIIASQRAAIPNLPEMEATFEEVHRNIIPGIKISGGAFVFNPPEGAEETTDLMEALKPGSHKDVQKNAPKKDSADESPKKGAAAPQFKLEGLKPGSSYSLAGYKGKVVLLDFFATWCPPCRKELPVIQKIFNGLKNKDFALLAVNSMEKQGTVNTFINEQQYTFPVALDGEGKTGDAYGVKAYPTLVLIDRYGKIADIRVGFEEDIEKTLTDEIGALLK